MATPLSKLSVAKRKREDGDGGGGGSAGAGSATAAGTSLSLLLQTPRPPRPLPSALTTPAHAASPFAHSAPANPLLSMPSPSSELVPVLAMRAQRQSAMEGGGGAAAAQPSPLSASGLLSRSHSATGLSLYPSPSSSALVAAGGAGGVPSASAQAFAAAAASHARQAEAAAALERERNLRLQVEELRADLRAKESAIEEEALKAAQRASRAEAAQAARDTELDALRAQLRFLHEEEAAGAAKVREQAAQIAALESSARSERAELHKLRAQVLTATPSRSSVDGADAESAGQIAHLESLLSLQANAATELESQLSGLQARVDELEGVEHALRLSEAERDHAAQRIAELEGAVQSHARESEQLSLMHKRAGDFVEQGVQMERLQAENARLQAQSKNFALQHEQILAASAKVARLESERSAHAKVALENEQLKARLHEWESSMRQLALEAPEEKDAEADGDVDMGSSPASKRRRHTVTPQPFLASYQQLQATNLSLAARLSQLELSSARANKEATESAQRASDLAARVQSQEATLSAHKGEVTVLQRRINLLTKERDGLQKVLDAYDNEGTTPRAAGAAGAAAAASADDEESAEQHVALKTRVKFLEEVIRELEGQVALFRSESGIPAPRLPADLSPARDPVPSVLSLLSQVAHLRKELAHIEAITSDLTEKVEWVHAHYPRLLDQEQGNYKIITLPDNPSHARRESREKQLIEEARRENQILTLRLGEVQAELQRTREGATAEGSPAGGSSSGAVGNEPSAASLLELESKYSSQIATLEREKVQLEKKAQRLKEVFGQKVLEFRQTCYLMTGFKIELIASQPAATYRLKSMYAEAEGDHLLFQQTPPTDAAGGAAADKNAQPGLSVMETDFTGSLDGATTNYLSKMHSIPGFLAAITLQLLERQTKIR